MFHVTDIFKGFDLEAHYPALISVPQLCLCDNCISEHFLNCVYDNPEVVKKSFSNKLEALAYGGLGKAICIMEPGENFQVANFTTGISVDDEIVVESCQEFPLTAHYSFPTEGNHNINYAETISLIKGWFKLQQKLLYTLEESDVMGCVINYDEFGCLTIEKSYSPPIPSLHCDLKYEGQYLIWFLEMQKLARYDYDRNLVEISKMPSCKKLNYFCVL
uniref:Uncharacterized protein n=1 Tax=Panagrolaimus sp. ES5 TaxID=591445 RepID=A0AC34GNG8_9BILA